jgi:3-phenylpropionate/trans-cinnamate dioxygenase ferredoxin reductase subunit
VIGAGWIGSEVAATARSGGAEVTLIEQAQTPLEHVLGPQLGEFFADLHRGHGVGMITGTRVYRIEEGPTVVLADGTVVEADAAVLGVGVAPALALAEAAGLRIDNDIVTDEHLRTSATGVFAAGDVARAHFTRATGATFSSTGPTPPTKAPARSMLDRDEPYVKVPFFFSDQYDLGMEYFGLHDPDDRLVIRGNTDDGRFQAFWIACDGHVTAGMHANEWDASDAIRQVVESAASLDSLEPQTA